METKITKKIETKRTKTEIGREIEARAMEWYKNHRGSRILAQNYRFFRGEIDFIAEEGQDPTELVFVEVRGKLKTQGTSQLKHHPMVSGIESLSPSKQLSMRRAAAHFLFKYRGKAKSLRYDLIVWDGEDWTHLKDIRLLELP